MNATSDVAREGDPRPMWVRIKDVNQHLPVSPRTARRWVASGKLPSHKIAGIILVDLRDIDHLILGHDRLGNAVGGHQ